VRITTPLIDAMSKHIVPMNAVSMNAVPVHPSTSLHIAAAPASSVATCAGVSGVQGTTVSAVTAVDAAGSAGLLVEAIQVKAGAVFALKPLGYAAEQQQVRIQRSLRVQAREERVEDGTTGSDSTIGSDSTTRDNGTNPFGPWDFRTSSPPG